MLRELLYFTKQERKQFYIMLLIVIGLTAISLVTQEKVDVREANFSFIQAVEKSKIQNKQTYKTKDRIRLSPFNPNEVTEEVLLKMGLSKRGIKSLLNYRKSGGRIKNRSHFKKMYGFEELDDHILDSILIFPIQNENENENENAGQRPVSHWVKNQNEYENEKYSNRLKMKDTSYISSWRVSSDFEKPSEPKLININTADTTELKSLYGIGSFRARRIINFRDALGGFHNLIQLYDTRYVPDSIITKHIKQFVIDSTSIRRIKINQATEKNLAKHPFISWQEAKLICNYKNEHGNFAHLNELYSLYGLDSSSVRQMLPYLTTKL